MVINLWIKGLLIDSIVDQRNRSNENIILRVFFSMYPNKKTLATGPYY